MKREKKVWLVKCNPISLPTGTVSVYGAVFVQHYVENFLKVSQRSEVYKTTALPTSAPTTPVSPSSSL